MIPICVIRNGSGPTALLTGANPDEYEGPLALYHLARTLDKRSVWGTIIVTPAARTRILPDEICSHEGGAGGATFPVWLKQATASP
ncbi:hypothetical protein [Mesorhizobium sp.]|uniref:hypothetical protein n=1 Tax=Mesorhizobium sp. TaxID=1871066 RepID=UPI000FE75AED|nr:hypothetical protein [Mesorhizobium sp.]RWQ62018.1 MAG: hypothetical protein EOS86_32245 [Mesorhizobium sp.]